MRSLQALAISMVAVAFFVPAVSAQEDLSGVQQSEWAESFDAQSTIARPVSTSVPILSAQTVPAMEQAIYVYEDLVARGGWPSVPADMELKIGVRDPRVVEL